MRSSEVRNRNRYFKITVEWMQALSNEEEKCGGIIYAGVRVKLIRNNKISIHQSVYQMMNMKQGAFAI